jgi:hypothetical protein
MSDTPRTVTVKRTGDRPTAKQVYAIAHALVEIAGVQWPETRGDASTLLQQLREQRDAVTAPVAPSDIPF